MLERVDYEDRNVALTGWLARPATKPRGAFVIFPNIMNIGQSVANRAEMLVNAGFVAMAADFYGKPAQGFEESMALSGELRGDVDNYRTRLLSAVAALRGHEAAAGVKLGAIGYCMGGQAALEVARSGEDLALVASFHGQLDTARKAPVDGPVHPRILVCHGDADPMVRREKVREFWEEMDASGANWHFHSYSGVKHGFTDPNSDAAGRPALGYNASADRQSWASFMSLADEIFG